MTVPDRATPALARLLADSALSRAALAACGFPVALADAAAKGRPLTYVNPEFERFFCYRASDVLGKPVITLLFPEELSASRMFEEAPARLTLRARRRDGLAALVEVSIGMVHGADGRLTHWVLAFADCNELERLRDELRLLRSIAAAP